MALSYVINGTTYSFPVPGDRNWGASVTAWAGAVTSGMLQKAGGAFTLTAEVDFGASFGLKALSYKSRGSNVASAGIVRLANAESIGWRNAANSADLLLTANGSDQLTFNGTAVQGALSVSDTSTVDLTLAASTLSAALVAGSITDSHVNASAAIALSKLAATTSNRALQTGAGGLIEASAVSSTALGYTANLSSDAQTQLNARLPLAGGTMTGALTLAGAPGSALHAATKQYVDDAIMGLSVRDAVQAATTAAVTLASDVEDGDTLDGVTLATGDRVLVKDQAAPAENGIYVVAASGAPARATDADTWDELIQAFVFVEEGTANGGTSWVSQTQTGGTLGVTAVTFGQFGGAASYTADGSGIELSGTTFSLELDGSTLSKSGSGLKVADLGITNAQVAAAAAITRSKIAVGTSNRLVYNDAATGALADLGAITTGRLVQSNASTGLPEAHAAMTGARVAVTASGGNTLEASSVTTTTLGYLDATSSIQTQLNAKASLGVAQEFTKVQGSTESTPAIAAGALTLDFSASNYFEIALSSSITSITINNTTIPGPRTIRFAQGGSFTVAGWPTIKWADGTAYTATSGNGAVDYVYVYVTSGGALEASFAKGFA